MDYNIELALCRAEAKALAATLRAEKAKAQLDYIAMMADIDIPEEEEPTDERIDNAQPEVRDC